MMLLFDNDIGGALQKACDHDNDTMHLVQAGKVVRREIPKQEQAITVLPIKFP